MAVRHLCHTAKHFRLRFDYVSITFFTFSVHSASFRVRYQTLLAPLRQRIAQRSAADVLLVLVPIQATQVMHAKLHVVT